MSRYSDLIYWLKLSRVKGFGPVRMLKLLKSLESISAIVKADDLTLLKTGLMNINMVEDWKRLKSLSEEGFKEVLETCERSGIRVITYLDQEYPQTLREAPQPPMTLFCMGDISLLNAKSIAIVGSRTASEKTLEWVEEQCRIAAEKGLTVVSGGAFGVDARAHESTLKHGGKTIVVLGSGLLKPYPTEHEPLYRHVTHSGGLIVSENLPSFPGSAIALLQRNRITSGLAMAVLICKIGEEKKGSLQQAIWAHKQGKPIYRPAHSLNLDDDSEDMKNLGHEYGAVEVETMDDLLADLRGRKKTRQRTLA